MTTRNFLHGAILIGTVALLAGCGGNKNQSTTDMSRLDGHDEAYAKDSTVWGLFSNRSNPDVKIGVNKYIWNASLEVLDFLPIQSVDPFSGVIVTGYGTPPGGGRAYRATIHITDPALDARSLKVALESRSGSISPDTVRAVEDAILTRARQLRVADSNL